MNVLGRVLPRALRRISILSAIAVAAAMVPVPALAGGGGGGDPAGNNGTVKIAEQGALDSIPNNDPHVGCTFQVEWYGFDQGADIISTVTFRMKAPTSDVGLTVDGDQTVFVGGDPASGAGTATGLDGVQDYTLAFDGDPHPIQGYHVKLTIHTPGSQGNDSKSKVFWVQGCESGIQPVAVGDLVWLDSDHDGRQDTGEPGISGVSLSLTDADGDPVEELTGDPVESVQTDANGGYAFTGLPPGQYVVHLDPATVPSGLVPTTPGVGAADQDSSTLSATSSVLAVGDVDLTLDFGFLSVEPPPGDTEIEISKSWNRRAVRNGGNAVATITATNPTAQPRVVTIRDVYEAGLTPAPAPHQGGGDGDGYDDRCGQSDAPAPNIFCEEVTVPAHGSYSFQATFKATYTGPAVYVGGQDTDEQLDVQKIETYVSLQPGDAGTFTVACHPGYFLTDASFHLFGGGGSAAPEDIRIVGTDLHHDGTWSVDLESESDEQAQGKVFGTCVQATTSLGGDIVVSGVQSGLSTPVDLGPTTFTATCGAGRTPVMLNLKASAPGFAQDELFGVVGQYADGSRTATVTADIREPGASFTLQWRCLSTESSTGTRIEFHLVHETVTVAPGQEREVQVTCRGNAKGIIGGWDGGEENGSEPRPVTRVYWFRNLTEITQTYTAHLLCADVRLKTGGHLDKKAKARVCNSASAVELFSDGSTAATNTARACLMVRQTSHH